MALAGEGMEVEDGPFADKTKKELAVEFKTLGLSDKDINVDLIISIKEARVTKSVESAPEAVTEKTPAEEASDAEEPSVDDETPAALEPSVSEDTPAEERGPAAGEGRGIPAAASSSMRVEFQLQQGTGVPAAA